MRAKKNQEFTDDENFEAQIIESPNLPPSEIISPEMVDPKMINPEFMFPEAHFAGVITYQAKSGWEKLAEQSEIVFKQNSGINYHAKSHSQGENKIQIFSRKEDDVQREKEDQHLFETKEQSSWLLRHCVPFECQTLDMLVVGHDTLTKKDAKFLRLHQKGRSIPCCPFNRPFMKIMNVEESTEKYLGQVINPCLLCGVGLNVLNYTNEEIYEIKGSSCQLGICCSGFPCAPCQQAKFQISDRHGKVVGSLEKKAPKSLKQKPSFEDGSLILSFPHMATKEDKALLISTSLLMQFMYFESGPSEPNIKV